MDRRSTYQTWIGIGSLCGDGLHRDVHLADQIEIDRRGGRYLTN